MKKYITNSEKETKELAEKIVRELNGNVVALIGELGAGKTTFVQGFAKALGIKEKVISPTFIIVRQHKIPKSIKQLIHIDLYRMEDPQQIRILGLADFFNDFNNLVLVEWADRAKEILPKNVTKIKIEDLGENKRKVEVS